MTEHPPIIGIDTSSKGIHLVSTVDIAMPQNGELVTSCHGWMVSPAKDAQERRRDIFKAAVSFFDLLPAGSSVWVEEPLVLRTNPETTRKLVMIGGVIEAAFMQGSPDALFFWVDVSTWRRQVLNPPKGHAPRRSLEWKALARAWVQEAWWEGQPTEEMLRLETIFEHEPDLYDAACICEYGRKVMAAGLVKIP